MPLPYCVLLLYPIVWGCIIWILSITDCILLSPREVESNLLSWCGRFTSARFQVKSVLGLLAATVEASLETTDIFIFYQSEHVMNFPAHWQLRIQMNTKSKEGLGDSKRVSIKWRRSRCLLKYPKQLSCPYLVVILLSLLIWNSLAKVVLI